MVDAIATESRSRQRLWIVVALLLLALGLKVGLLLTSQSMADGDEAVTGLMAQDILEGRGHPIYPYGVQYGAGATVEAHLAAAWFGSMGISDLTLKASGLLIWCVMLALVVAVSYRMGCRGTAMAAGLLFAFAPSATQWSLKVGGGHNTAVALSLLVILLIERQAPRWLPALLLPLTAVAHPIVAPFAVVLAGYLLITGPDRSDRGRTFIVLLMASVGVALLLRPPDAGVWNPAAREFDPVGILTRLPALGATLFSPNLNSLHLPGAVTLAVALLWMAALLVAAFRGPTPRRLHLYLLAALPVLITVQPGELAPRHLLLLYPLGCIAIALALPRLSPRMRAASLLVLLVSGAGVQVAGMADPNIYGPAPQDRGIVRENLRALLAGLEARGVRYVYCLDPMFQWNLVWGSRGRVIARWVDPEDRLPDHPAQVDAARLAGRPVALVGPSSVSGAPGGQRFGILPFPDTAVLEATFPLSPRLSRPEAPR